MHRANAGIIHNPGKDRNHKGRKEAQFEITQN
jgi:hypothetical protein